MGPPALFVGKRGTICLTFFDPHDNVIMGNALRCGFQRPHAAKGDAPTLEPFLLVLEASLQVTRLPRHAGTIGQRYQRRAPGLIVTNQFVIDVTSRGDNA